MKKLITLYADSSREFSKVSTITTCAMCGALSMVMNALFTITLANSKIAFYTIPNQMVYYLFGPVVGSFYAAAMDILNYLVTPNGAFFPIFTLNAVITAMLYGTILYKQKISFWRILIAEFIVVIICNIFINTYGLSILMGKGFIAMLPGRIIKNIIMWPVKAFLFYIVMKPLEYSGVLKVIKRTA